MNDLSQADITLLLNDFRNGNKDSFNQLLPIVYKELRRLASRYLKKEYSNRTIQTTELVHEAYIRLVGSNDVSSIHNRAHFFGIAANSMRQILVDYARKKNATKRGGDFTRISLYEDIIVVDNNNDKIIAIDEALKKLSLIDNRLCRIVELRFFTGLSIEETAEVTGVSVSTIKREWNIAKAWLFRELEDSKNH
jgi:RNA polymerase sigma factor (TIGR02999 family)